MKALAEGFRVVTSCHECTKGKVTCPTCSGKKRADQKCPRCLGSGWQGVPGKDDTVSRCRNCRGAKIFKNSGCRTCKRSGKVECPACEGSSWREGKKVCVDCRVCKTCNGAKTVMTKCSRCNGFGRYSTNSIRGGVPNQLCDFCDGKGVFKRPCAPCKESGLVDCTTCKGSGPRGAASAFLPSNIYSTQPCTSCAGKGWPVPGVLMVCTSCMGQGARLLPWADRTKVLPE